MRHEKSVKGLWFTQPQTFKSSGPASDLCSRYTDEPHWHNCIKEQNYARNKQIGLPAAMKPCCGLSGLTHSQPHCLCKWNPFPDKRQRRSDSVLKVVQLLFISQQALTSERLSLNTVFSWNVMSIYSSSLSQYCFSVFAGQWLLKPQFQTEY